MLKFWKIYRKGFPRPQNMSASSKNYRNFVRFSNLPVVTWPKQVFIALASELTIEHPFAVWACWRSCKYLLNQWRVEVWMRGGKYKPFVWIPKWLSVVFMLLSWRLTFSSTGGGCRSRITVLGETTKLPLPTSKSQVLALHPIFAFLWLGPNKKSEGVIMFFT